MQIIRARETGSSPRVRGSLSHRDDSPASCGIIPAGAGLTSAPAAAAFCIRDHPRGCGAHCAVMTIFTPRRGSSPRVRGSLRCSSTADGDDGIIPAGAGLTTCRRHSRRRTWDHPRGCGAHSFMPIILQSGSGSSPRVRGSLEDEDIVTSEEGIIPAGAGLTQRRRLLQSPGQDHPRGCGAHME